MTETIAIGAQDQRITDVFRAEWSKLRNFIRKHVDDQGDAEDILQDVCYELIEAYRLLKPIEQAGAWLYRVARNRITDRFRKKRPDRDGEDLHELENLLPSSEEGPDAAFARRVLMEAIAGALEELPEEQRSVFVAHEIEGRSFKDLAAESGLGVNTLLSRKHYAVLHLRQRLAPIYEEVKGK